MPEITKEVTMVAIEYICDECNKGKMRQHGKIAYMTDPIQIPHKCDKCGHQQSFQEPSYPRTGWIDAD